MKSWKFRLSQEIRKLDGSVNGELIYLPSGKMIGTLTSFDYLYVLARERQRSGDFLDDGHRFVLDVGLKHRRKIVKGRLVDVP